MIVKAFRRFGTIGPDEEVGAKLLIARVVEEAIALFTNILDTGHDVDGFCRHYGCDREIAHAVFRSLEYFGFIRRLSNGAFLHDRSARTTGSRRDD